MSILIGEFLYEMRREIGATAGNVCEGICTASAYSYYENNQRIPDFLTLNFILERLGHGITGLAAYVSKEEMKYLHWRRKINTILRGENWDNLEEELAKEPQNCIGLNKKIKNQYTLFLQAICQEMQSNDSQRVLKLYQKAIQCTCSFLLREDIGKHRIGKMELILYALYLRFLGVNSLNKSEALEKLEKLIAYVDEKINDEEEKVNTYPHLVCIWLQLAGEEGLCETKEAYLEKAYMLLVKKRKMYHVTEVLRGLISCKKSRMSDYEMEKKAYDALCHLYRFFDKDSSFHPFELSENMWMFTVLGEYLGTNRKNRNFSQEEISEGVCATESYSRIENGQHSPNRQNYEALTQRMGIETRYVLEVIRTGSYRAVKLRKALDEAVFYGDYRKADEYCKSLRLLLRERNEEAGNKRYLTMQELTCLNGMGELGNEEMKKILKMLLSETLELKNIGQKNHVYTRLEIELINRIAANSSKYEEGGILLKKFLEDMEEGEFETEQRFRETYLAALNLDKFLSDEEYYGEGNELCMKWGKMAVQRGWATYIDEYMVEIAYNLRNMDNYTPEYTKKLCECALQISEVYGTRSSREQIRNYLNSIS